MESLARKRSPEGRVPVASTCPNGFVVTGHSGRAGGLVDQLRLHCGRIQLEANQITIGPASRSRRSVGREVPRTICGPVPMTRQHWVLPFVRATVSTLSA